MTLLIIITGILWAVGAICYNYMFFGPENRKYTKIEHCDAIIWIIIGISITIATPVMAAFDAYWAASDLINKR